MCRVPISAVVAAVIVTSLQLRPLPLALASIALGLAMLAIAVIDADRFIVPDWLSLPAIPLGLLASGHILHPDSDVIAEVGHIVGAIAGGGSLWLIAWLYKRWRQTTGLGMGDVKLAAAAGAWVGIEAFHEVLLLASGTALLWVALVAAIRRRIPSRVLPVPFGAFLAPSTWLVWILSRIDLPI